MSQTSVTASALDEALVAAGEAVAAGLPSDQPWSARPATAAVPPAPGAGARAVAVELPGVGRLVLAVSGPLAGAVLAGPPPSGDLPGGVAPALASAVAALCTRLGLAFPDLGDPVEVDAVASLRPGPGEEAAAVLLYEGDGHSATLVLIGASDSSDAPGPPAASDDPPAPAGLRSVTGHEFAPLPNEGPRGAGAVALGGRSGPIELLSDVEMGVTVELGRTRMLVRDILELSSGSVIELDRAAGAPIDVLVNGTLIARGEVVVIDEEFGIRITEVIGYDESDRGQR
jgi:flagellar motor switch protein FliN